MAEKRRFDRAPTQVKIEDLTGQRFGRLTALRPYTQRAGGKICWVCRCDCGIEVAIPVDNLRSGATRSCGCLRKKPKKK